ncbi:hypothetical protein DFH06DRAFT_310718 [Mycena polygramma]|nr:hypothetical protein DFH06DRAFT_310718 [Mycena polygramma]
MPSSNAAARTPRACILPWALCVPFLLTQTKLYIYLLGTYLRRAALQICVTPTPAARTPEFAVAQQGASASFGILFGSHAVGAQSILGPPSLLVSLSTTRSPHIPEPAVEPGLACAG